MENETNKQFQRNDVFSKRIRAGKRRTYFFDVRTTKGNDYYLTITESKKRFHDDGYERHKIFVYKEDFNKFIHTLEETIAHIKENLMPEYDFDTYTREPEDITKTDDDAYEPSSNGQLHAEDNLQDQENGVDSDPEHQKMTASLDDSDEEVISWD